MILDTVRFMVKYAKHCTWNYSEFVLESAESASKVWL